MNKIIGSRYDDFVFLPAEGTSGGILVAWQSQLVTVSRPPLGDFSVTVHCALHQGSEWWFSGVYGPSIDERKQDFLEELRAIRPGITGPWIIAGYFNLIADVAGKDNNCINRRLLGQFRKFISELDLLEANLQRRRFTWSNKRRAPMITKIDHWLSTAD